MKSTHLQLIVSSLYQSQETPEIIFARPEGVQVEQSYNNRFRVPSVEGVWQNFTTELHEPYKSYFSKYKQYNMIVAPKCEEIQYTGEYSYDTIDIVYAAGTGLLKLNGQRLARIFEGFQHLDKRIDMNEFYYFLHELLQNNEFIIDFTGEENEVKKTILNENGLNKFLNKFIRAFFSDEQDEEKKITPIKFVEDMIDSLLVDAKNVDLFQEYTDKHFQQGKYYRQFAYEMIDEVLTKIPEIGKYFKNFLEAIVKDHKDVAERYKKLLQSFKNVKKAENEAAKNGMGLTQILLKLNGKHDFIPDSFLEFALQ